MFKLHPMLLCDFYKISHRAMYPAKTEYVYSTWTPRGGKHGPPGMDYAVVFGHQYFVVKWLVNYFNEHFFKADIDDLVEEYISFIECTLGDSNPYADHIRQLHSLGYLPLRIESVPEGIIVPLRTPVMTIVNTHPDFFWLTNYIESLASAELWQASTSATIANEFRMLLDSCATETVGNTDFVPYQAHDFSFRGMSSVDSAVASGMGHLLSFKGTDNIPAILAAKYYYNAHIEAGETGTSIPASEHSVQCSYGDDIEYFHRLITEVHPSGLVSIVADGYDFWDVIERVLPQLRPDINQRNGKVVIRPDSGDPVKIICGDFQNDNIYARKGAVQCLAHIFGVGVNAKGFRELDSHIGLIYGDAITRERADEICTRLKKQGFASNNVVFGVGSYTYQYNTRDTLGYALKSTAVIIDDKEIAIFKAPKTDDGTKVSQKGRVHVWQLDDGSIHWSDSNSPYAYAGRMESLLRPIFQDGQPLFLETFEVIKERLAKSRARYMEVLQKGNE